MGMWLRDMAPTFVIKSGNHSLVGLDWNFNGWGGKYPTPTTKNLTRKFLQDVSMDRIETSIVTEGGALEADGEGTLLATESSIINDSRNPGKNRQDVENELRRTLGAEKVIWIPGRVGVDATDGHIDALARFARPGVVLLSKANEFTPTDRTTIYEEALEILQSVTDAKGRPIEIIEIEEPDSELFSPDDFDNHPSVRSYVNYVLVNGGIILPQFGDPAHDAAAIRAAQRVFGEERRICPVLIEELPLLGGGPHTATQEIPLFHRSCVPAELYQLQRIPRDLKQTLEATLSRHFANYLTDVMHPLALAEVSQDSTAGLWHLLDHYVPDTCYLPQVGHARRRRRRQLFADKRIHEARRPWQMLRTNCLRSASFSAWSCLLADLMYSADCFAMATAKAEYLGRGKDCTVPLLQDPVNVRGAVAGRQVGRTPQTPVCKE
ncbi:agmatine deiminase [Beauveria bassiana ARSEF 2860]|uniref:Agmatine deiminase n=1 Tax=Beauveria bassiana (strain ARSEF 2860) TaxID=655819 RepID=J5JCE8_BEAB2|nr:agmatine deiminase [Beauveria bassiana ARSEF 2860]EJP61556.1 agmatine deiminase [Beauveria bassiana ARSEF 2860]